MQNVGKANLAGAMLPYYLSCNAHYQFDFCDTQSAYIDAYTHNSYAHFLLLSQFTEFCTEMAENCC